MKSMKPKQIARRFSHLLALLLAVVLCFSACGGNETTSSEVTSDTVSDTIADTASTDETGSDGEAGTSSEKTDTAVSSKENAGGTTNNQTTSTTTKTGKTTWDKDYLKTLPASVKKKGVTILMWRDLHPTEQKLVNDFEKKTGCEVTIVKTISDQYTTKLVSLISADKAPDVVLLDSGRFPGIVTKAMQPLDKELFRLDDSCWYKAPMENFKINGNYYAVAMAQTWSCTDAHYVTYYQPSVLKNCGISVMPYQLYQEGKWNWTKQHEIAQQVISADRNYIGISLQTQDIAMLAAGTDFVKYDGKKYTNIIDSSGSSLLAKAWQSVARLSADKLLANWELTNVKNGKVGLFTAIAYGMYNEADWDFDSIPGGADSIHAVPVAGPTQSSSYIPYRPKAWGVAKGAENPEGAAYFLRYYLDAANSDFDSTFLNDQCKEVFQIITKASVKKQAKMGAGAIDFVNSTNYSNIITSLARSSPANISQTLDSHKGTVTTALNRANKELAKLR